MDQVQARVDSRCWGCRDERKKDRINKEAIVEERKALYTKGITQIMMMVERRHVTPLSRRDGISAVLLKDEWESDRRGKAVHEKRPITQLLLFIGPLMCAKHCTYIISVPSQPYGLGTTFTPTLQMRKFKYSEI